MFSQYLAVVRDATKAVPAVRYALGIAGVMAAFALGKSFFTDARVAFFAALAMLALMVLLVVFAKAATQGSTNTRGPATILLWAMTLLFVVSCTFTVSAVFLDKPKPFPQLMRELFASASNPATISCSLPGDEGPIELPRRTLVNVVLADTPHPSELQQVEAVIRDAGCLIAPNPRDLPLPPPPKDLVASPEDQEKMRRQFFNDVIAPRLADIAAVQFKSRGPFVIVDLTTHNTLGRLRLPTADIQ